MIVAHRDMGLRSGNTRGTESLQCEANTDESDCHKNKTTANYYTVALLHPASLTFTRAALLLISWATQTSANGDQPLSIRTAVHFRLLSLL